MTRISADLHKLLEAVSRPVQALYHARRMKESFEEVCVFFMSDKKSSLVLQLV
jgi:hypothetical protein